MDGFIPFRPEFRQWGIPQMSGQKSAEGNSCITSGIWWKNIDCCVLEISVKNLQIEGLKISISFTHTHTSTTTLLGKISRSLLKIVLMISLASDSQILCLASPFHKTFQSDPTRKPPVLHANPILVVYPLPWQHPHWDGQVHWRRRAPVNHHQCHDCSWRWEASKPFFEYLMLFLSIIQMAGICKFPHKYSEQFSVSPKSASLLGLRHATLCFFWCTSSFVRAEKMARWIFVLRLSPFGIQAGEDFEDGSLTYSKYLCWYINLLEIEQVQVNSTHEIKSIVATKQLHIYSSFLLSTLHVNDQPWGTNSC